MSKSQISNPKTPYLYIAIIVYMQYAMTSILKGDIYTILLPLPYKERVRYILDSTQKRYSYFLLMCLYKIKLHFTQYILTRITD